MQPGKKVLHLNLAVMQALLLPAIAYGGWKNIP
jgi:hypothetical protein